MSTRNYRFHIDPGHGWLEVPRADVIRSGITPSQYSYQKDGAVYLEEDCDASAFWQAFKRLGIAITTTEVNYNDDAPIRDYSRAAGFGV